MGNVQAVNGRFQGRFRGDDERQHSKLFATAELAWAWVGAGEAAVARGDHTDVRRGRMTLGDFHQLWWPTLTGLDPTSKERIDSSFRIHILPEYEDTSLRRIEPLKVAAWAATKEGRLAPSSLSILMAHFYRILEAAAEDNRVPANLVARIKKQVQIPKRIKGVLNTLTQDEVTALATVMPDRHRAAVWLAAMTGMRLGEVLGLSVDNVVFLRRTIRVVRQLKVSKTRGLHLAPPKTNLSRRDLPLPAPLVERLSAHLAAYPATRVTLPEYDAKGRSRSVEVALIVSDGVGAYTPSAMCHVVNRVTKELELRLDGELVSFHDLRHHFASVMLGEGMKPVALQKALGHANLTTTLDTYCHWIPDDGEDPQHAVMDRMWTPFVESLLNR